VLTGLMFHSTKLCNFSFCFKSVVTAVKLWIVVSRQINPDTSCQSCASCHLLTPDIMTTAWCSRRVGKQYCYRCGVSCCSFCTDAGTSKPWRCNDTGNYGRRRDFLTGLERNPLVPVFACSVPAKSSVEF